MAADWRHRRSDLSLSVVVRLPQRQHADAAANDAPREYTAADEQFQQLRR
jgi:hypothetical protein